jgi:acetoin utilization protein AcuC
MACRLVDAPRLPTYDLGIDHPFARERQLPLFDLLARQGLIPAGALLASEPADRDTLATAHDPGYVAFVEAISAPQPPLRLLEQAFAFGMGTADNPIGEGQHAAAAAIAGATLGCVREVMAGRAAQAFNPAGGLHHAMPARASGFCVYNDLVIGIRAARALGAERVLYADFDVHHGDGVQAAFWTDPNVMTISFHETPDVRWPFTGYVGELGEGAARGTKINVPLASHTADASWLEAVHAVLVPAARRFRPDLIVSQHGCDPHFEDPLAELELTTRPMYEAARLTLELATELCGGRWVATGGGGYQPYRVIPRAWALVWMAMTGQRVPAEVDAGWRAAWQHRSPQPLPATFFDAPQTNGRHERAARANRATLDELRAAVGWS